MHDARGPKRGSSRHFSGRGIWYFIEGMSEKWISKLRETCWDTHTVPRMFLFFKTEKISMISWSQDNWYQIKYYYLSRNPFLRDKTFLQSQFRVFLLITDHSILSTSICNCLPFYSTSYIMIMIFRKLLYYQCSKEGSQLKTKESRGSGKLTSIHGISE